MLEKHQEKCRRHGRDCKVGFQPHEKDKDHLNLNSSFRKPAQYFIHGQSGLVPREIFAPLIS